MLATLNPDKPILDSRVKGYLNSQSKNFGYSGEIIDEGIVDYDEKKLEDDKNKLYLAISEYKELELWYEEYVGTDDASKVEEAFDTAFPEYKNCKHFTRTRKIDWYLWLLG